MRRPLPTVIVIILVLLAVAVAFSRVARVSPSRLIQPAHSPATEAAAVPPASISIASPASSPTPVRPRSTPIATGSSAIVDSQHELADNQRRPTEPRAWGAFGVDGGGVEGIVGADGSIAPVGIGPSLQFWLRNDATGELFRPAAESVDQSLTDGFLPMVASVWSTPDVEARWTVFARSTGADPIHKTGADAIVAVVEGSLVALHQPGSWTLFAVVSPENAALGTAPVTTVKASADAITANATFQLIARSPSTTQGTLDLTQRDLVNALAGKDALPLGPIESAHSLGAGYLGFTSRLETNQPLTFTFFLPMTPGPLDETTVASLRSLADPALRQPVAEAWRKQLQRLEVQIPNRRLQDAFYASLAYLLMARRENGVYSGPTSERAMWVRDAAYLTDALVEGGQADTVKPILRALRASQLPSGRLPPTTEPNGAPRLPMKTEWDAQGEYIFAVTRYVEQTGDKAFLEEMYPSIVLAARYQKGLLDGTRIEANRNTPLYGILPAGESAEDLYSADWHHYWDDFWALTGYHEAAAAARLLGQSVDAGWLGEEEYTLRADVLNSVAFAKTPDGKAFIANGPEDIHSTAMARSGTPAIWPVAVLDPKSELVQHTFEAYYAWTIAPNGGAYKHYGDNDWPYAGIGLAHAFYQLDMVGHAWEILDWTMDHQTMPNLYVWGEAIDPHRFDVASGDSPHAWMAAELVMFIRDMLWRGDAALIQIGPFPADWLPPTGTIALHHVVGPIGDSGYRLSRSPDGSKLSLDLEGDQPTGGYRIHLPPGWIVTQLALGGGVPAPLHAYDVLIPPGTRTAEMTITQ